ncbi:disintegrin and metalloproteinase domain-containing protein 9-like isoform X2 [Hyperolius riggenbachi]|uniref:disintegrin and metalloproteinase domain-containing protein 9-like isoform X2 n=1 Tax=Hyperolius riggenbachi TaxID=752182 RepID=UPI0035A29463
MASLLHFEVCIMTMAFFLCGPAGEVFQVWYDSTQDDYEQESEQTAGLDLFIAPSYEIIEPKLLSIGKKEDSELLLYTIKIATKPFAMSLKKHVFIPADFQVFIDDRKDADLANSILYMRSCYYTGKILEVDGSSVVLQTCFGLSGMIEFVNKSYIIEPLRTLSGFQHLLSKMETKHDVAKYILDCDTDVTSHLHQREMLEQFPTATEAKQSFFAVERYLKVSVFVTVEVYRALGSSPMNVITNLMQVFSHLNMMFAPLNMQVFLSGVGLWTESNSCSVAENLSDTLENFIVWLSDLSRPFKQADIPLLIVGGQHAANGTTYFGQICSHSNGAVLTFPTGISLERYSSLVAHILGHNLGMLHDNQRKCDCPDPACIMDMNIMTARNVKHFSSCSKLDFQTFVVDNMATCLLTHPNMKPQMDSSLCGNRMLDRGESCDCGSAAECENDPCCDYRTCTLKPGAQCASGACCSNCQFLPMETQCRRHTEECDLPEFCSGEMAACPEDVHQQNGNPCSDHTSICFNGKCQSADKQCEKLFGQDSHSANLQCYHDLNIIGDRFGNCGGFKGFYFRCQKENVLCGKLHCVIKEGGSVENISVSYEVGEHQKCVTADYPGVTDPLLVNDGTMCGTNKICIKQVCRDISRLSQMCERDTTCHGHGVCNSKHTCHCDPEWEPPLCAEPLESGQYTGRHASDVFEKSADSCIDETINLRNWLLIVFLLVVPVSVIITATVIKRKKLKNLFQECMCCSSGEEDSTSEDPSEMAQETPEQSKESGEDSFHHHLSATVFVEIGATRIYGSITLEESLEY